MNKYKPIPIGYEDFKTIIDKGCYFVDKSLLIKELIDNAAAVSLFTRPRRFGKTLNMSMIKYFFEKTEEDNSYLFENLKISEENYQKYQGKYPIINLSFKSMKQGSYENAFYIFKEMLSEEFQRHRNILDSNELGADIKKQFKKFCEKSAKDSEYLTAIRFLSNCLYSVYGERVIILIDEYDVPLQAAYFNDFYDEIVNLISSVFESALKTNSNLEFGVLTGCLRVSKESIFTGLNNLDVYTVTENNFSQCFGFTESEIIQIAELYDLEDKLPEMKRWYDGYLFGETEIYNPWSILKYVKSTMAKNNCPAQAYWGNTSSNDIIQDLISKGSKDIHNTIESLMNGESIIKPIYDDITYRNLDLNSECIWSFLLFTGYLKPIKVFLSDDNLRYMEAVIPNIEVKTIYTQRIVTWFRERIQVTSRTDLFESMLNRDVMSFQKILKYWLSNTISYYDTKKSYSHGFLAGLLVGIDGYKVKSNRESGNGRPDILIFDNLLYEKAIIIEVKYTDNFKELESKCDEALEQIKNLNYEEELINEGYADIIKYGIAFHKKTCKVKLIR